MNTITGNKIGTRVNVMLNGALLSKECGSEEVAGVMYSHLQTAMSDPTDENVNKMYEFLNENIRIARFAGFEHDIEADVTYMEGFETPVPQDLLDIMEEHIEKGYPIESFSNFWKLLMANPDKRVREDLFGFIKEHDFVITSKGYLVVYKTVDYKQKVEKDLAELISNSYLKIKDKWKEAPSNYSVYKEITRTLTGAYEEVVIEEGYSEAEDEGMTDEQFYDEYGYEPEWVEEVTEEQWVEYEDVAFDYKITKTETMSKWIEEGEKEIEVIGRLDEMQTKLDEIAEENKSVYTDKYSHTMQIRLGEVVKMDRSECDGNPRNECSYGLHVGATKYVENFITAYRRNADENDSPVLVCLVNPMNVVAVPEYDNSKMRVTEYYPYARGTVRRVEGNHEIEILENSYFENDYANIEQEELNELLNKIRENEQDVRQTALNVESDERSVEEYEKILASRVLDLS